MALTDDEKALLDKLTEKANAKDDDDFDVEIWDETGAGARVPYRKGKSFLSRFGIDVEAPSAGDDGQGQGDGKDGKPAHVQRYFGNKKQAAS